MIVVDDIEAARDDLSGRGVDVSEIWDSAPAGRPGRRPRAPLYLSRATSRIPTATAGCSKRSRRGSPGGDGRTEWTSQLCADLLHETSGRHGLFEAVAPPHDWWDWYAAYMVAREGGSTRTRPAEAADRYMAEVKKDVVRAVEESP